jgi:hypothetical protein
MAMAKTTSQKPRKLTSVPPSEHHDDRDKRIAERAYQLAALRGFTPGGEVDDWLAAEREVDAELKKA